MERKKEEWKRKIEGLDKEMIKWKWTSNREINGMEPMKGKSRTTNHMD